jgi:uncharacterized protein
MFESLLRRDGFVNMCPAGTTQLVVDAGGDVYPCWMFAGKETFRMGNVMRDPVFNDLAHKVLGRIKKNDKTTNAQCSVCYARYVCSACIGNNENSTGKLERIDERFCNNVRQTLKTVVIGVAKAKQDAPQWNALVEAAKQRRTTFQAPSTC